MSLKEIIKLIGILIIINDPVREQMRKNAEVYRARVKSSDQNK